MYIIIISFSSLTQPIFFVVDILGVVDVDVVSGGNIHQYNSSLTADTGGNSNPFFFLNRCETWRSTFSYKIQQRLVDIYILVVHWVLRLFLYRYVLEYRDVVFCFLGCWGYQVRDAGWGIEF